MNSKKATGEKFKFRKKKLFPHQTNTQTLVSENLKSIYPDFVYQIDLCFPLISISWINSIFIFVIYSNLFECFIWTYVVVVVAAAAVIYGFKPYSKAGIRFSFVVLCSKPVQHNTFLVNDGTCYLQIFLKRSLRALSIKRLKLFWL